MTVDPEHRALMSHTVTIAPRPGVLVTGEPSAPGTPQTIRCYVYGRTNIIRADDGNEKVSNVTVILDGVYGVKPTDVITLPAAWVPRSPKIVAVAIRTDERGAMFETVFC